MKVLAQEKYYKSYSAIQLACVCLYEAAASDTLTLLLRGQQAQHSGALRERQREKGSAEGKARQRAVGWGQEWAIETVL